MVRSSSGRGGNSPGLPSSGLQPAAAANRPARLRAAVCRHTRFPAPAQKANAAPAPVARLIAARARMVRVRDLEQKPPPQLGEELFRLEGQPQLIAGRDLQETRREGEHLGQDVRAVGCLEALEEELAAVPEAHPAS
eukprot:4748315-Pyramimonas_sp.AAC.1